MAPRPLQTCRNISDVEEETIDRVREEFPMFVNTYWLSQMKEKGDIFWKQVVPDAAELNDPIGIPDPLDEEGDSPVPQPHPSLPRPCPPPGQPPMPHLLPLLYSQTGRSANPSFSRRPSWIRGSNISETIRKSGT